MKSALNSATFDGSGGIPVKTMDALRIKLSGSAGLFRGISSLSKRSLMKTSIGLVALSETSGRCTGLKAQ